MKPSIAFALFALAVSAFSQDIIEKSASTSTPVDSKNQRDTVVLSPAPAAAPAPASAKIQHDTIVLSAPAPSSTPGEEYTKAQLVEKVASYTRMHNRGRTCLISGVVLLAGGAAAMGGGLAFMIGTSTDEMGPNPAGLVIAVIGEIALDAGLPLTVVGGVISGIGGRKMEEYKNRLKNISLYVTPNGAGLTLKF